MTQDFDLQRIGQGLAFAESLADLRQALTGAGATAVVQAPPGTGKTTLVPPLVARLVGADEPASPRVIVTQPRRVAARSAARRLAQLTGTRLGELVGYTVRGESRTSAATRVEFVTAGLLLRRLLGDPGLDGVGAVVLDEVHERGLETDLLLGLLADVHELRGDLRVVAMSATLDAPRFAELLGRYDGGGPAPVVDSPSVLHALEVRYTPLPARGSRSGGRAAAPASSSGRLDERGVRPEFLEHVAATAASAHAEALAADAAVDALVFLPGAREVDRVAAHLERLAPGTEVLPLHGQLAAAAQDRAVSGREPGGPPRIVVSTALAESSLTVPGVRLVIDAGLAREPRRDARGMSGLVTVSASRAACEQRAGRAARQGPGTVVRCFEEKTWAAAAPFATAEVHTADLTQAALTLACWGSPRGEGLPLPDALPPSALADAELVLRGLGAITESGHATETGRRLAEVPADPRLARALYDGAGIVGVQPAAEVVALLAGDLRGYGIAPAGGDVARALAALRTGKGPEAKRWGTEVRRFAALADGVVPQRVNRSAADDARAVGVVTALANPEWIARRTDGQEYLLASGTRAQLAHGSALSGQPWVAAAEVARTGGAAVIRAGAAVDEATALEAGAHLLTDCVEAEFVGSKVRARRQRRLGSVLLESTPVTPRPAEAEAAVQRALRAEGLAVLGLSPAAHAVRQRMALLHRELGEPWPDVSEEALLGRLQDWLAPEIGRLAGGAAAGQIDLAEPLRRLLPWPDAARFDELVPERLRVPSGNTARVTYDDGQPVVAVKLQECYGWAETPRLVDGRVPVLFHLLSPAGRPLAVTADLHSFWEGPYAQVRAEMRGRYPKHPWPEDPWTAPATARTKNRM
ncbi:ATP-dependent RNA helicase [Zhihengliuella flava]|uniref:ATP-dependent helicase HrpB n=1 Tax=Zhihengliuella flava TaxID=1285193 RepID=A0A931D8R1_9MICC|nr:ATP-dependent helicase C-terminal domain-containing protein [Zhihengliuella flava]MBG6084088.1 ATP-dependent helicase HrpB [Zhihengliuella flava]